MKKMLTIVTALIMICAATAALADAADDKAAADKVAALIDAIYVQEWTEDTDARIQAAKEAWDALTDAQKELVEGEEADPDYFGRDTGDVPRNADSFQPFASIEGSVTNRGDIF